MALSLHQSTIFPYQQFEVLPFLVGKFQKHLLAFRILETLSILLEEAV